MKTFDGYKKRSLTDTNLLLAAGGDKPLSDFIGTLNWDSTNRKLQYKKIGDTSWNDLVTFGSNALTSDSHNYLPLSGGTMTGTSYIYMPASAASIPNSQPFGITYGKIGCYGSLGINADTDGTTTEYLVLTSGYGYNTNTANGLAIGYNSLTWKNNTIYHSGNIPTWNQDTTGTAAAAKKVIATDNTAANGLLHSGVGRPDSVAGDTWIFVDDLDLGNWGIKHDQPGNNIDFYGQGKIKFHIPLYTDDAYSTNNFKAPQFIVNNSGTCNNLIKTTNSNYSDLLGINDNSGAGGAYIGQNNYWIRTGNASEQPKVLRNGTAYTLWHSGNDGSGSGLDADLLDGLHSSAFYRLISYNNADGSKDCNDFTSDAFYTFKYDFNSSSNTLSNKPSGAGIDGGCAVLNINHGYSNQIFFDYGGGGLWFRGQIYN